MLTVLYYHYLHLPKSRSPLIHCVYQAGITAVSLIVWLYTPPRPYIRHVT